MPININNVYGNDSTFYKVPSSTGGFYPLSLATLSDEFEFPYFNHTLGMGLLNGQFSESPDISICPIGMLKGNAITDIAYYSLYNDSSNQKTVFTDKHESITAPLMYISNFSGTNTGSVYSMKKGLSTSGNSDWTSESVYTNKYAPFPSVMTSLTQPIAEFQYKSFILCPIVYATNSLTTSGDDEYPNINNIVAYDLYTYIKSKKIFETYKYLVGVSVTAFSTQQTVDFNNDDLSSINFKSIDFTGQTIDITNEQNSYRFYLMPMGNSEYVDQTGEKYLYFTSSTSLNETYYYYKTDGTGSQLKTSGYSTRIIGANSGWSYGATQVSLNEVTYTLNREWFENIKNVITNSTLRLYQWTEVNETNATTIYDYVLQQVSYFGMYFNVSISDIFSKNLNDIYSSEFTYLGLINEDGYTDGTYANGKAIKNYPQSGWDSLKNQSPFEYTIQPDNTEYDDETKLNTGRLFTVGSNVFTNVYALSRFTTFELRKYLYSVVAPESTSETNTKQFLTNNPIDCIVGCFQYPFNVIPENSSTDSIRLGNTNATSETGVELKGYQITDCLRILDFGTEYYFPKFGDFRDYEPYSECLLYIPYTGYIPISPSEFIGHNIGVKMIVDVTTGACLSLIYKDSLVIQAVNGTIGLQIPITGIQQADYANAIHNAKFQSKVALSNSVAGIANATISGIASGISGNSLGLVSSLAGITTATVNGVLNIENATYNLNHTQVPFKVSGSSSPACDFDNEQICRLILKRPIMDNNYNSSIYGKTVGFACTINSSLSNFTGFTQVSNADLSGVMATIEEKKMIVQLLQSGVYL